MTNKRNLDKLIAFPELALAFDGAKLGTFDLNLMKQAKKFSDAPKDVCEFWVHVMCYACEAGDQKAMDAALNCLYHWDHEDTQYILKNWGKDEGKAKNNSATPQISPHL